ncbi:MAG TPA: sigma-70 family RNA polymerase sigma factor [Thermoanaerobaculia bacterium]|nr:sigma-70 family RNA polymerase sigma factor [Thermoanaerobaculia bacterium]
MTELAADELLTENLPVIERAIAFAARRYHLTPDDAEEFGAIVRLRLVENDYAILRAYEQRSSFATFISIVVQRMALDFRVHEWGRWHSSAEAKRLGPLAIELEQLLHRDGRRMEDAVVLLRGRHEGVTRESLQAVADRLPPRPPRHRDVALDDASESALTRAPDAEEPILDADRRRTSARLSDLMSAAIARLPDEDRVILQLRFENGMTVAQIARAFGLDQKLTYRRIEKNMREIRRELERAGIAPDDVADLIGRDEVLLHFDLGNRERRPSIPDDERTLAQPEETR